MTTKDLITVLQGLPPEAPVRIRRYGQDTASFDLDYTQLVVDPTPTRITPQSAAEEWPLMLTEKVSVELVYTPGRTGSLALAGVEVAGR